MYKVIATVGWALLALGWTQRRKRARHVGLMLSGIGVDLALVLVLEFSRGVIGKTFAEDWSALQVTHIATSAAAVVLYFPTVWYGLRLLQGRNPTQARSRHKVVATVSMLLRTIGFACMWAI